MSWGGASLLIIVAMIALAVLDGVLPPHDPYWDDDARDGRGRDETGTGAPK